MKPQIKRLPAGPLPEDVIDRVARELALEVATHIEIMYPDAAASVAWQSAARSIQGVIRNHMAAAGRAAENGRINRWLAGAKARRRKRRAMWRNAQAEVLNDN